MKKILLLSLFICLTVCLGACTKRDKLTGNNMVLQIEQVDSGQISIGNPCKFKAIVRNIKLEEVDEPVSWSVSPSDIGSFTPTNTHNTSFMAEKSGDAKITLYCQGISVSKDITISGS